MERQVIINFPRRLENRKNDIIFLSNLWHSLKNRRKTLIIFDLSNTQNIFPNTCAPLGMIIEKIKSKGNEIAFFNVQERINKILISNNFMYYICRNVRKEPEDLLSYRRFSVKQKDVFEKDLLGKLNLFTNINKVYCEEKEVTRVLSEMFVNVKMHTKSKDVSVCGYYDEEKKELCLSISNHGITISKNIEEKNRYIFGKEIEAICWAVKRSSSTRSNCESGGLGFYTTRRFIQSNKGALWIVSGRGYWFENNSKVESYELKSSFPGTLITIKIPLDYNVFNYYKLKIETISIDDIIGEGSWNL